MKNEQQHPEAVERLNPRTALYIKMAIEQYHNLYIPAAREKGLKLMTEADYVVLALENYDDFEVHIKQCQLLGHKMQTEQIGSIEVTACIRCGATGQLGELLLLQQGIEPEA